MNFTANKEYPNLYKVLNVLKKIDACFVMQFSPMQQGYCFLYFDPNAHCLLDFKRGNVVISELSKPYLFEYNLKASSFENLMGEMKEFSHLTQDEYRYLSDNVLVRAKDKNFYISCELGGDFPDSPTNEISSQTRDWQIVY